MEKFDIPTSYDVPPLRREVSYHNATWLLRNLGVKNSHHPDFEAVLAGIKSVSSLYRNGWRQMKVRCPNSEEHAVFITTAHEMHKWVVDSCGEFISDSGCLEVTVPPRAGNSWTCKLCGADAIVEDT